MKALLELDHNTLIACSPAIVFFCVMVAAFSVDQYLQNRRTK